MAKVNQFQERGTVLAQSNSMNMPICSVDVDDDSSETDFELDEEFESGFRKKKEAKSGWQAQFQHLLEFSEDILPTALYEPMKWCHISIHDSIKHVAKTEEILQNIGNDTRLLEMLEMQLEAWKRRQQTSTSKSRMLYSVYLYKHAGDVFYFAFYQNRGIAREIREQMETAFLAEFGSVRLNRTRARLKVYLRQFAQIEDFLSVLPEIYRSEVLTGLICDYLNANSRGDEDQEIVSEKMNELLSSPDYHENQISLMLLAREDCLFKQVILNSMMKYMITDPLLESIAKTSTSISTTNVMKNTNNSSSSSEDLTRDRIGLFLEAESNLLVKACLATEMFSPSLFDIIAIGLDAVSLKIMKNRSEIYEDFRPPLFDKTDPNLSLPKEYFTFFEKMQEASHSTYSLFGRVKNALSKFSNNKCVNTQFWRELFALLNDANSSASSNNHKYQESFIDIYRNVCGH